MIESLSCVKHVLVLVWCGTSSAKLCRQVITSDRGHRIWLDLANKLRGECAGCVLPGLTRDQAARFIHVQRRQEHLKSGSSGITTWPHCSETNQLGRSNIGRKPSPDTQYGHRTISLTTLGLQSFRPPDQSGNSIRSGCFLSRSCSSARTFSSQYA